MIDLPGCADVDVRQLENIFDDMTNSYKIFWFLGVFEEIILNKKKEISFKEVVARMIVKAWYPLLNYNLNFGAQDQMAKNIRLINNKYINNKEISNYNLYKELSTTNDTSLEKIMKEFYKYVPYRLLRGFYKISSEKKSIYINDNWYRYILKNQNIIKGWVNYNLILFLQNRNPSVPAIPLKLEAPIERDLKLAKEYWNTVVKNIKIDDIYTGKIFTEKNYIENGALSIDHFLPWSFVGHDELWNLIPTFRNINSSKRDSLPKYDVYIDSFSELQFKALDFMRVQKDARKYLEEYLSIDKSLDIKSIMSVRGNLNKNKFIQDLKMVINPLYQIAYNQGFDEWTYNLKNKDIIRVDNSIVLGSNVYGKSK